LFWQSGEVGVTRIVLVEANFIRRQALHQLLAELGAEVVAVTSAAEAAQAPAHALHTPGVVLIEYQAALEQRAFELVRSQRDLRIVLVSWQRAEPPASARAEGAHGFIDLSGEERTVRSALQRLAHHGEAPGWPLLDDLPEPRFRPAPIRPGRVALDMLFAPYLKKPSKRM
jgi:DNA-binding NarL/FixJ family response regulator